jgi:hypothetical protein
MKSWLRGSVSDSCYSIKRIAALATSGLVSAVAFAAPGDLLQEYPNPNPQTGAQLGYAVDGVQGTVLAGAPFADFEGATASGIAYRFNVGGGVATTYQNPFPTNNDEFGHSIEGMNNHVLVGAPFDEVIGAATGGAVHVFRTRDGQTKRAIASPSPQNNARFGWSVHTLKNKFVAGAPEDEGANSTSQAGAAYLLNLGKAKTVAPAARDPKTTYLSPRPSPNDEFGYSVSALDDAVVVGAPSDDFGASNAGAAFSYSAKSGAVRHIFNNPNPEPDDSFGFSVAAIEDEDGGADGNDEPQLAIGAPDDENNDGVKTGRVYVFDSASGALQLTIDNPDPDTGDLFGTSVHNVDGNIVVGAPGDASNVGIAYLFDGQNGNLLATFHNPEPESNESFGFSVSQLVTDLKGKDDAADVIVGCPGDEVEGVSAAGTVYLFRGVE